MARWIASFVLLFMAIGGCQKKCQLAGDWTGSMPSLTKPAGVPDVVVWTMRIEDDGSFKSHFEMHVMMNIVEDTTGTVALSGDKAMFSGTTTYATDDGYKKNAGTTPYNETMTYKNGVLRGVFPGAKQPTQVAFVRKGSAPPAPLPVAALPSSDPKAKRILIEVERRYAAFKTYSDKGTLFASRDAEAMNENFSTTFKRSDFLRFNIERTDRGKEAKGSVSGKRTSYLLTLRGGGNDLSNAPEYSLAAALYKLSKFADGDWSLVMQMLEPSEFGNPPLHKAASVIQMAGKESLNGKPCWKIQLSLDYQMGVTLWVDQSSYLIRRLQGSSNERINYEPRAK